MEALREKREKIDRIFRHCQQTLISPRQEDKLKQLPQQANSSLLSTSQDLSLSSQQKNSQQHSLFSPLSSAQVVLLEETPSKRVEPHLHTETVIEDDCRSLRQHLLRQMLES
jgi:hypothetical protein